MQATRGASEVHVWRASLRPGDFERERLLRLLSNEEREHAGRFYYAKHRDAYIAARGTLRELLGAYLQRRPEAIPLVYGSHGKPEVKDGGIQFNLSHSGDIALFAFTQGTDVSVSIGVDIESQERDAPLDVAQQYFCRTEFERLSSLTPEDQPLAFYQCWTRKEALIKALGLGLAAPLDQFAVAFGPEQTPRLLNCPASFGSCERWHLVNLDAAPGYVAALAIRHCEASYQVRTVIENGGSVNSAEGSKLVRVPLVGTTVLAASLVSVMFAEVN